MDQSINKTMLHVEDLLKDKCTHYMIAVTDGDTVQMIYNSSYMAHGLACKVQQEIELGWKREFDQAQGEAQ